MSQGKILALNVALLLAIKSQSGLEGLEELRRDLEAALDVGDDREADVFVFDQPVFGVVGDVLFPDDSDEVRDLMRSGLVLETKALIAILDAMIDHLSDR